MLPIKIDLPEDFLNEEIRCGYTVTKQKKELWAIELDLLVQVQKICKKHDIQYFAYAGTMLGAVRHNGFIPWDDDIDIMMTRANYKKFCDIAEKELEYTYFLQTEKTDTTTIMGLAKIRNSKTTGILKSHENRNFKFNQGIFLDIFPLDNIPDEEETFYKFKKKLINLYSKYHILRNRFHCDLNEKSVIKRILSKIPVPSKYNEVLTVHFGNWKEYVIGTSVHGELIIDINKSYKEYIFDKINGRRCT